MVTLCIEHAISEFGTWKQAFDRFADTRRDSGAVRHRIHRPIDDDRYVVIELDFGTRNEASEFLDFLTTRVWSTQDRAPALIGTPQTRILDLVEQS